MLNMNQERDFRAYVSTLAVEGKSIVLWVQRNEIAVRNLESALEEHCASGWTLPPRVISQIKPGTKCFALNSDTYIRVVVLEVEGEVVSLLARDYGIEFSAVYRDLMLPVQNDPYIDGPDLAEKFYLFGLTLRRPPISTEIVALGQTVCYKTWSVRIEERRFHQHFASFYNGSSDLKELINTMGLGEDQHNMRMHASNMRWPMELSQPIAHTVKEPSDARFINPKPLPLSATIHAMITDASDGPWGFTIQKDEDLGLMRDIAERMQKVDKIMLENPFFLGQTCLAYCPSLLIYARGLIVGMTGNKVNVNFVDYGVSAVLSSKELFKLPNLGLATPILGHRFTLAGINDVKIKDEERKQMIEIFQEIVANVKLVLRAVPSEDVGFQTCELYQKDSNVNVKKMLNLRMQRLKLKYSVSEWPAVDSIVPAFICHMESPELFYVQLKEGVDELQEVLQDIANSSQPVQKEFVKVNMPCLALFTDEQWYRALIRKIVGTNLEVFFVDYGNNHVVTLSHIKEIPVKVVSGYKIFAIPCALDDQKQLTNQELKSKLEAAVNADDFQIQVTAVHDEKLVVKLLQNRVDYFKIQKSQNGYGRLEENGNQAENYGMPNNGGRYAESRFNLDTGEHRQAFNWRSENSSGFRSDAGRNRFDESQDSQQSNWRSGNAESATGFNSDGGRKRFDDSRDSQRSYPRENREPATGFDGDVGRKRFDDNRDSQRSYPRREPGENGSGFNEDGGRKRFDDNRDGQRSYPRSENRESGTGFDGAGGRKRYDDNRDGQRSYPRGENRESASGFDGDGGRKRYDDNRDGQRSYQRGDNREPGSGFKNRDQGDGGNKFGDDDRPRRQPIRNDDRITPGDTFPEPTFDADQTEDVIVTAFVSPHEFFVQTQAQNADFLEMMTNMQSDYYLKYSFKKTDPPQENDPVVAEFSEDRVQYRATVISSEPMTVRFVDYGNFEEVRDSRNLYPVMRKYAEMPVQAVKCTLKGVKCIGDAWPAEIAESFENEAFSCIFHENNDGVYVVSLSQNGSDLATDLIARNLVSGESTTAEQLTTSPEDSTSFEGMDKTLLPGQVLIGAIPFVSGVQSFFIHLQSDSVTKMVTLIADFVAKGDLKQINSEDLVPGALCLLPLEGDDAKYRGEILEIENDQISVKYIDYGDTCQLGSSEIFYAPEELKAIPGLAIECTIFGDTTQVTDEIHDQFKSECELQSFIVDVKGVEGEKLSVIIYDLNGQKLAFQDGFNDAPGEAPLVTLPLLTREITAEIFDFVAPSSVLIRLPHSTPVVIEQFYTDVDANEDVEINALCAVKTSDGSWYRAKRLSENQAYLLDNGRTEDFSLIRKLVPECRGTPVAVSKVQLTWLFLGKCRVTVERTEDGFAIEPIKKLATISFIESANDIFVSPPGVVGEVIDGVLVDTVPGERNADKIFAARFPADEQWYRAEVIDEDTMTVRFIDYGNTSEVTEVAPLPHKLKLISPQAVAVHFEGSLPETALHTLEDLQTNEALMTLTQTDQGTLELHLSGFNLITKLTGLLPLAVDDTVYISHCVGPEQIFLQRDKDATLLAEINEKLNNTELVVLAADAIPNQLVAAKYQLDGTWYRARVDGDKVAFIDHGNDEDISELRELPEELKNIPPLAQKAALLLTEGSKWTEDAANAVGDLYEMGFQIQEVSVVNGSYVVRLFKDDSEIGQKIVVEAGNVSEATTEPVSDDSEFGRDLVEELVDDVVSSFVAEEVACPDSSGSYDSGTFSKDLNHSPQDKNEVGNQRLGDELCSAGDNGESAFDTAIVEDTADVSVDSGDHEDVKGFPLGALEPTKVHLDPLGTEDLVVEDIAATLEVASCDLDSSNEGVLKKEIPDLVLNSADEDTITCSSDMGSLLEDVQEETDVTLDVTDVTLEDLQLESADTGVEANCSDHAELKEKSDITHQLENLALEPVEDISDVSVKVEIIDLTLSEDGTFEQAADNSGLDKTVDDVTGESSYEEASTQQTEDENSEATGAEKPADVPPVPAKQLLSRKVSSDEKIVPGSINRGIVFSDK